MPSPTDADVPATSTSPSPRRSSAVWLRTLRLVAGLFALVYAGASVWNLTRLGQRDAAALTDPSRALPALADPLSLAAPSTALWLDGVLLASLVILVAAGLWAVSDIARGGKRSQAARPAEPSAVAESSHAAETSLPTLMFPTLPGNVPPDPTLWAQALAASEPMQGKDVAPPSALTAAEDANSAGAAPTAAPDVDVPEPSPLPAPPGVAPFSESAAPTITAPTTFVPHVFISHSSADNAFGGWLVDALRQRGIDVWYDSRGRPQGDSGWDGLLPGDQWWPRILHELGERDVFLVILSPKAMASKWVRDECTIAWSRKNASDPADRMVIIPVLIETTNVRLDLRTVQMVRFLGGKPSPKALDELLEALRLGYTRMEELEPVGGRLLGPPFEEAALQPPEHFIGRAADLQWLVERLRAGGATGITAVNGMGASARPPWPGKRCDGSGR
ncbi:MAG TPA: TIR domain-containing protein, partial [Ktedonobacterales bacterium]